jgi:hypothetical protein
LHAMKVLDKTPEECVAVEDSRSGATAAFRAGIKTIGYTGSYEKEKEGEMREVLEKAGCCVVMKDWSEFEVSVFLFSLLFLFCSFGIGQLSWLLLLNYGVDMMLTLEQGCLDKIESGEA